MNKCSTLTSYSRSCRGGIIAYGIHKILQAVPSLNLRLKNKRNQLVDRKKIHLSIENTLLICKAVIKPIWSYGIELWGCASKYNIHLYSIILIMQRSQTKILRAIANAPCYVTNHTLHTDFNIPYVTSSMKESINITTTWKPIPIHY